MKLGEVGIRLGLGVKDFRAIFIFHDHNTINRLIESNPNDLGITWRKWDSCLLQNLQI
jgi:hypothetical protein